MHVNTSTGGLQAVDNRHINDRLFQAIQNRKGVPATRDLQITPAPQPLPNAKLLPGANQPQALQANSQPSLATLPADLIADISDATLQGAPEDALSATNQTPKTDPLQSLLDSWDTNNKDNDLNGDGIVNVFDLFQLLSSLKPADQLPVNDNPLSGVLVETTGAKPLPRPDINPAVADADVNALPGVDTNALTGPVDSKSENPAPLTLEGLMAAFGSTDARFDINSDGTVNVFDLFQFLSSQQPSDLTEKTSVLASVDQNASFTFARTPAEHRLTEQKLQHMADRLVNRLNDAGFDQHPPANLNEILGQLNINDDQRQIMLQRIGQHYPAGLGVSMIG